MYNQDYLYTIWDNTELKKLFELKAKNRSWDEIARVLKRSPGACKSKYRGLKTGLMFIYGKPEDTLNTYDPHYHQTGE